MRASCTDYYELITDNFITSGISTYCVIIVQPLFLPSKIPYKKDRLLFQGDPSSLQPKFSKAGRIFDFYGHFNLVCAKLPYKKYRRISSTPSRNPKSAFPNPKAAAVSRLSTCQWPTHYGTHESFSFIFDLYDRTPLLPSPSRTREGRMEPFVSVSTCTFLLCQHRHWHYSIRRTSFSTPPVHIPH